MMRAIRFASVLHFEIEKNSLEAIKQEAERIKIVSMERIMGIQQNYVERKTFGWFKIDGRNHTFRKIIPELTALKRY